MTSAQFQNKKIFFRRGIQFPLLFLSDQYNFKRHLSECLHRADPIALVAGSGTAPVFHTKARIAPGFGVFFNLFSGRMRYAPLFI
jgi:hypothetical protein